MKKLLFTILAFAAIHVSATAQFSVVGSKEYGRIMDVLYDPQTPNKVYAATLGNHIVSSEDNGQNWKLLYSHPEKEQAISQLKYLSGNRLSFTTLTTTGHGNKLYILDLVALNVGQTYEIPTPGGDVNASQITSYDIFQANSNIALIQQSYALPFTSATKVYYTNNGGDTWNQVYYSAQYSNIYSQQVAISPANAEKLFITLANGVGDVAGGIFISNDAGTNWTIHLDGMEMNALAFNSANPDNILAATLPNTQNNKLMRSLDGGNTWQQVFQDLENDLPGGIRSIVRNASNPGQAILLGATATMHTADDFVTWQTINYPIDIENVDNYSYASNGSYNPFNSNQLFISASDYALFSDDSGNTLTKVDNPYFLTEGYLGYFAGAGQSHFYYSVQHGYIHENIQTGTETPYFILPLQTIPNWNSSYIPDQYIAGRMYIYSGSFGGSALLVSNNHGEDFGTVASEYQYIHAVTSHPLVPNKVWASLSTGASDGIIRVYDISNLDNIQQTTLTLPIPGYVSKIIIAPNNVNNKVIVIGTRLFVTLNNGGSWQEIMDLPLDPAIDRVLDVAFNPFDYAQIIVTTNQGIYKSFNSGFSYIPLADFLAHRIWVSPETPGNIVAVTYDHFLDGTVLTLRFSIDGGFSWTEVNQSELNYIFCERASVRFSESTVDVYMGTDDLGVVRYSFDFDSLGTTNPGNELPAVSCYPNPGNTTINVNLEGETIKTAAIYAVTGQKVIDVTQLQDIDISELPNGLYLIRIKTMSGKSSTAKFIKN